MKKYIELTEENYFKALELGFIPMNWIKRQATKGSDLLNKNDRVITFNGSLLDFRRECNLEKDSQKVGSVEELKIAQICSKGLVWKIALKKKEWLGDIMELIDLNNTFCKATRENYNKLIKLGFKNPCELRKSDAFLSLHNNIIWMGKTSAVKKEIFLDENNNWKYKKINSEKINNKGFS